MLDPINIKYFKFAVGDGIGKESINDISAKCIICGDSENDTRQKRLHLYRKSSYTNDKVHCFNCSFSGNMYMFLKECNSNLYEQYKKENRENNFHSIKEKRNHDQLKDAEQPNISFLYKQKEKEKEKEIKTFEFPKEFIPAEDREKSKNYLLGRKLKTDDIFFSEKNIKIGDKYIPVQNSIIIPLWYNKEKWLVYGFQARSIEGKKFYSYIPEENTGYKVWFGGGFPIKKEETCIVTESIFDSMSTGFKRKNVCAILGASENSFLKEMFKNVIYCLDNQRKDRTSLQKSKELLEKGEMIFIWPKEIEEKDFNAMIMNGYTEEEINKIIKNNIFIGMKGILKLKLIK